MTSRNPATDSRFFSPNPLPDARCLLSRGPRGGWANAAASGTVTVQPSASYSVDTAGTDCSRSWDRHATPESVS